MGTCKKETWRTMSPINCFSHANTSLSGTCACVKGEGREGINSLVHNDPWSCLVLERERREGEGGRVREGG